MSTYKELMETAIAKGKAEELTVDIVKFNEPGQFVLGRMLHFQLFDESEFDDKCMKYTFDTDDGKKSLVVGGKRDEILAQDKNIGCIFCITFTGKVETKNKKRFNTYNILRIPESTRKK